MRRLRFSHTTMFRARQTLARTCFSSGQIFSTIFITQSLINSPSVKDLQCLAISVALKRRPSLSAFLFLVTVTILEIGWKGSHKGHVTKVLPHLCLATFCWNVKYFFLYMYNATVNHTGGVHITYFMTEAAGRRKFEHGPQFAPRLDFGHACLKLYCVL